MANKKLTVTAPLVVLKAEDGTYRHLYEGTPVPGGMDEAHVKQLVDAGMLGEVQADEATSEPSMSEVPAKSASKATWVAYATDDARGEDKLSQDDAEALTRDQLAEKFSA